MKQTISTQYVTTSRPPLTAIEKALELLRTSFDMLSGKGEKMLKLWAPPLFENCRYVNFFVRKNGH